MTVRPPFDRKLGCREMVLPPAKTCLASRLLRIAWISLALVAVQDARGEGCPPGDLTRQPGVRTRDQATVALGRAPAPPGSIAPGAVDLGEPLPIDLGTPRLVRAVLLQGQGDDEYLIEGSKDGRSWTTLAFARPTGGEGQQSRALRLSRPREVRYLRLTGTGGDGEYSIWTFSAWCRVPERPPVADAASSRDPRVRRRAIRTGQAAIAMAGLLLFLWGIVLRRLQRPDALGQTRDGLLAVLGLLAGVAWWNFGLFHAGGFVHTWEHAHYFLGAKYFEELGYTDLYACITVADLEDGLVERVADRKIRDMVTNRAESSHDVMADPERTCTDRFATERWQSFRADVRWFRSRLPPAMWELVFLDHGYNAPPGWTMLGRMLTRNLPASERTVTALALIDPMLLVVMWIAVAHAFGWRAVALGMLWWGTNRVADFAWTGGALLRQDWLLLTILGICLAKKGRPGLAGFSLGYATLLRVFPVLVVGGLVLQVVARSWTARRISLTREHVRFALGCGLAFALLIPLSAAASGGVSTWNAFVHNARSNLRSTGGNIMGLMTVLTHEHSARSELLVDPSLEDPNELQREAKRATFRRMRPVFWVLLASFAVLLARAVRDREIWVALTLGLGLIPIGAFIASYYYAFLLGYGALWRRWGNGIGVLLCGLSIATHAASMLWADRVEMERRFAFDSLAVVLVVLAVTSVAAFRGRGTATSSPG